MSEEFEDVAVVETAPVESAAPVDTGVAYVPEALPSEVEATELNLNSADDVLKNNDQQVYNEINAPDRVSESAAPITAQAVAAKEEKKAEERSQSFEAYEEQLKQIAARKEFMNKDHDFGGMKMSGADLSKLMDFYQGNPQMLDKLKDKMVKSGMSKEKADKGVKELQEYMDLKKQEKDGTLTAEQAMRLKEINKSEEFKVVAQEAKQFAKDNGVQLSQDNSASMIRARTSAEYTQISKGDSDVVLSQSASKKLDDKQLADSSLADLDFSEPAKKPVTFVAASARGELPKTVALTEAFKDTIANQMAAVSNRHSVALGSEAPSITDDEPKVVANANSVALSQRNQPATVVASL